jgi:hypothetical protein
MPSFDTHLQKSIYISTNKRGYLTMSIKLADSLAIVFHVWLLECWYVPSGMFTVFGKASWLLRKKNSYSYFAGPMQLFVYTSKGVSKSGCKIIKLKPIKIICLPKNIII